MNRPVTTGQHSQTTDTKTVTTTVMLGTSADNRSVVSTKGQPALTSCLQAQASSSSSIAKKRKGSVPDRVEVLEQKKPKRSMINLKLKNDDNNIIQYYPEEITFVIDQLNSYKDTLDEEVEPCVFIREIKNKKDEIVARVTLNADSVNTLKANFNTMISMLEIYAKLPLPT